MPELIGRTKGQPASAAAQASRDTRETTITPDPRADDAVVRRTKDGWRVGSTDVPDLTSAMVLADLISAELSAPEEAAPAPAVAAGATATADAIAAESPGDAGLATDKTNTKAGSGSSKPSASWLSGTGSSRARHSSSSETRPAVADGG